MSCAPWAKTRERRTYKWWSTAWTLMASKAESPSWNAMSTLYRIQSNLFNTDTKGTEPSVRFTEVSVVHSNHSLRTPLYYGQFVWSQKCQKSYIPYFYTTDTSVNRTLGSVPLVSVLKRFDCIEVGNVWFLAFLEPNELSVIERCRYYRGVRKEKLDCSFLSGHEKLSGVVWTTTAQN